MSDYSDLDRQIEQLKRCEIIKENEVKVLCAKAREILIEESNVQRVDSPVTVSSPSSASCRLAHFPMSRLLWLFSFFIIISVLSHVTKKNNRALSLASCRCAATFTDNFTISRSCSRWAAMFQRRITCSWVTLSIEDTTQLRRFCCCWHWRSVGMIRIRRFPDLT